MSMSRRCDIWLATDKQWYMVLGNKEYAYDDHDCTAYGPFPTEEAVRKELDRHSNPGSLNRDVSGRLPPPSPRIANRKSKSVLKRKSIQTRIR